MGYCISMRDSNFTIKKKNEKKCLAAIKELMETENEKGTGGSWRKKKDGTSVEIRWFSWMNDHTIARSKTLDDAMGQWCYPISRNDKGEINGIDFNGEKIGDEVYLFKAIAPFVESGCYIEMQGEDGAIWRWAFSNGKMIEKDAKIVFED